MDGFAAGRTDVLVATTVIEVGIDVANATVMLIEGAERYGVSQLHQLRGRVGRGEHESHCMLFAEQPGELARRRLEAVAARARRLQARRGRPRRCAARARSSAPASTACRASRVAELPEDTPALLAAREEVLACCGRHGSLDAPELGPLRGAAGGRFGADAAIRSRHEGGRAGSCGGRRLRRAARVAGAADLRPRPRGDLLGARRRVRRSGARPLLRHRRARDRGALARRRSRDPRRLATPAPRSATSQTSGSRDGRAGARATPSRWLASAPGRAAST